jgi:NAD-dependent SIR2 family protein deacetylase
VKEEVLEDILSAIAAHRLVVFAGAGLSIPKPSNLPTARQLAIDCAEKHYRNTGTLLDESVRTNLEALAVYFLEREKLESYFVPILIDWKAFSGEPNPAHYAVADFLLAGITELTVTTNVDALIEIAAEGLGADDFESSLSGSEASEYHVHRPLLKLHGCVRRDRRKTLWCPEQLATPAWSETIENSAQWLGGSLMERDLVFVGYWTDWDYLTEVLERAISYGRPRSVTVVDISEADELKRKAAALWQWAHRDGIVFRHLQMSGSDFLDELRSRFSRLLLHRICDTGRRAFEIETSGETPSFPTLLHLGSSDLYNLRRDWTGSRRDRPTTRSESLASDEQLGKVVYRILAAGGSFDRDTLVLGDRRIRLIQTPGRMLYSVKAEFEGDVAPSNATEVTVCVGANDDGGVATNVVRGNRSSVVRPGNLGQWYCTTDALTLLGLVDNASNS